VDRAFRDPRARAARARAAATAADTDKTKPTASFSFRALDTIARFVECLVEHLDERLVGAKGARRESATRATETETLRGDDDDETTPSGVRLGEAMGVCLANLAREIDIELSRLDKASGVVTISAPRARAAAGEMASALTAYLEAGDERAADEFRATFADAAEKAFAETTAKTKTFTFSSSSASGRWFGRGEEFVRLRGPGGRRGEREEERRRRRRKFADGGFRDVGDESSVERDRKGRVVLRLRRPHRVVHRDVRGEDRREDGRGGDEGDTLGFGSRVGRGRP
jgi:hypothetical protein